MPCIKVKVAAVIVEGFIASVKTAVILLLTAAPVSVLAGKVELTLGIVLSSVGVGVGVGDGEGRIVFQR